MISSITTGEQVVYTNASGGPAITGLTSGATYTVNVLDDSDFQLLDANGCVGLQTVHPHQGGDIEHDAAFSWLGISGRQ